MPVMVKVKGVEELRAKLRNLEQESHAENNGRVIVGYTAAYALYVHEAVGMVLKGKKRPKGHQGVYWSPLGKAQAKFLEQPMRELSEELGHIVHEAVAKGSSLLDGLVLAGLRLQRESQLKCPVDTGNLRGSAFTRKE